MSENKEYDFLGKRKLIQKGGSIAVTLPVEVTKALNLKDEVAFVREKNRIFLANPAVYERSAELIIKGESLLGHPITQKELDSLIEGLKKEKE